MRKFTFLFAFAILLSTFGIKAQVVISQVYGGGGNTGATLTHDFIELYNRGTAAVDISDWSLQYASASGTPGFTNIHGFASGTIIQPGKYFLVQEGKGSAGTTALPTPDHIPTNALNMGATNGKVALANSTTAVTGPTDATVIDFVGFGTANQYEGSGAVAALTNTTAAIRAGNGATDTNNNSADFFTGTPNPRNSSYSASAATAPSITPASGNIYAPITVTITAAAGASIYYTTNGSEPTNASTAYTAPFNVSATTMVKAIAYETGKNPSSVATATYTLVTANTVANIAALRAITLPSTEVYKLTGEAVLTLKATSRNAKYIQDATGAILIDDASGKITTNYNLGDGITGITGTLALFQNMLQFTPTADPGAATSTGNTVAPLAVNLADLTADHQAKLVRVPSVSISDISGGTGLFVASKSYDLNGASNPVLRTQYNNLDYIGQAIPTAPQTIVGVVLVYGTTIQLVPRSLADIATGISTPKFESLSVWTSAGKINFGAAAGEVVEVYNTMGQKVFNSLAAEGQNEVAVSLRGVAIVKVGNRVGKVIL